MAAFFIYGIVSGALIAFGGLRLIYWILDRRDARVDAAYRAARLVAISRAETGRG